MSEPPARRNGITGAITGLGERLIAGLPGQFLALIALNIAFILGILWFVQSENALRAQLIDKILDACSAEMTRSR